MCLKKNVLRLMGGLLISKVHLDQVVEDGDIPPLDTEVAIMAWKMAIYEVAISLRTYT